MKARRGWIVLLLVTAPAWGQDIYRCGDSYGPQPCEGGRLVDAADARSAAQRSQSETAARTDARLADAMERERLRQLARAEAAQERARKDSRADRELADEAAALAFDFPIEPELFIARVPAKPQPRARGAGKPPREGKASRE